MTNFTAILDKPASAVEKPRPYPVGTYLAVITDEPEQGETSSEKRTPFLKFKAKLLAPQADVDQAELIAQGGIAGKTTTITQWLTEDSLYRLKTFLTDHLGIDETGKSLRQMIAETRNRQLLVTIKHRASKDGTSVIAEVDKTAPVV
jgi:hypothetical protein